MELVIIVFVDVIACKSYYLYYCTLFADKFVVPKLSFSNKHGVTSLPLQFGVLDVMITNDHGYWPHLH